MTFAPRMTDDQRSRWNQSKLMALAAVACGLAIGALFAQFTKSALADAAGCSAGAIAFTAWAFWGELERSWFWRFLTAVLVTHGVAIALVSWPPRRNQMTWDFLGVLGDLFVMVVIGLAVRCSIAGARPRLSEG